MSSRRRATNKTRGRGRANKTNLDDLDGALNSMIGSSSSSSSQQQQEVKITVDPDAEERRFTMHSSNERNDAGIFASSFKTDNPDMSGCEATHTAEFEKHQVNYGATKYIKP